MLSWEVGMGLLKETLELVVRVPEIISLPFVFFFSLETES